MPAAGSGTPAAPFSDVRRAARLNLRTILLTSDRSCPQNTCGFVIMRNGRAGGRV